MERDSTIAILGVGLIGGSLGAALRSLPEPLRVLGIGRSAERLAAAQGVGIVDEWSTDVSAVKQASLVIVCTPVDRIATDVRAVWPHLAAGAIVTDAGSTKSRLCAELAEFHAPDKTFLGSHPIAGSHRRGYEAADPELFAGRQCVVTPLPQHSPEQVQRVETLWKRVGMRVCRQSPEEHDQSLAATSHLPHLTAALLAQLLPDEYRPFTGTGFRDTTRVAAGEPELWTAILLDNRTAVAGWLTRLLEDGQRIREALIAGDGASLKKLLEQAKTVRDALDQRATD